MITPKVDWHADRSKNVTATLETDVLVVGTGPAGASLACFLAQNGERWNQMVGV